MTAIVLQLDERLRSLDPATAAKCEQLVRDLLPLLDQQKTFAKLASDPNHKLPAFRLGLKPGIDPTKLNQPLGEPGLAPVPGGL